MTYDYSKGFSVEPLCKLAGYYRGRGMEKAQIIKDNIEIKLSDRWFYGDLYIYPWPGTENEPDPFPAIRTDNNEDTPLLIQVQRANSQTGEWEPFDYRQVIIAIAEKGDLKISTKWIEDNKRMSGRTT